MKYTILETNHRLLSSLVVACSILETNHPPPLLPPAHAATVTFFSRWSSPCRLVYN